MTNSLKPIAMWKKESKEVVLLAMLQEHPNPREFLINDEPPAHPGDFAFIWNGTIMALEQAGYIEELPKLKKTMFRRFRLTSTGLKACARAYGFKSGKKSPTG